MMLSANPGFPLVAGSPLPSSSISFGIMAQNYGDLESDYAKFPCRMLCFFGHSRDRGRDPGFRRPGVGHDCVLDIRGSALGSPVIRSP
jgi:hypothetical protein